MTEVVYCARCVEPSSRPDSNFDSDGVCFPCRYAETLDEIDWQARARELDRICAWGRETSLGAYDCIIGVSGGKDSHRQSFFVRDELGLKPLLVSCVYPPEQQTERGARNLANLIGHGFDVHMVGPAPKTSKRLMRHSFRSHGNLFKITELALYAAMPRVAIANGIPLIFLGENPALNFGGNVGSLNGDGNMQRLHHTLAGARVEPLLKAGFERKDLYWYDYPSEEDFTRANIRIVYLGYYMKDFNDVANSRFAIEKGLEVREGVHADPAETGSINPADAVDDDFVHVNQFLKYLKFGFGKVTQQAAVKARYGTITRARALDLVRKYDGKCSPRFIAILCHYLGIDEKDFWEVAERYRDLDLWQFNNRAEWELRYTPK